ncbi:MAG: ankyrin repeat domain-containing protein [Myxococcota bacterium]
MSDRFLWRLSGGKDADTLRSVLAAGADPNAPSALGTPLGRAVVEGSSEVVRALLEAGADPNLPGARVMFESALPPLVAAARVGRLTVIEHLVAAGAAINGASGRGQTPLHAAATAGKRKAVRWLLAQHSDLEARDLIFSRTALLAACHRGRASIVYDLLEAGSDATVTDNEDKGAIHLLFHSMRPPPRALLEALARAGAPIDTPEAGTGWHPLHLAAFYDRGVGVRWLLERGVDPERRDRKGLTAAALAVGQESFQALDVLLRVGSGVKTAMHSAAASPSAQPAVLEAMIAQGLSPGALDEDGRTPLEAVLDGWPSAEEMALQERKGLVLLAAGATPSPTLLVRASRLGATTLLSALLRVLPASPEALWAAAQAGRLASLDALLDAGAPVQRADEQGNAALHHALRADQIAAALRLVSAGADLEQENRRGMSARAYASAAAVAALAGAPPPAPVDSRSCPRCGASPLRDETPSLRLLGENQDDVARHIRCAHCAQVYLRRDSVGDQLVEVPGGASWQWWDGRWRRQWRLDE